MDKINQLTKQTNHTQRERVAQQLKQHAHQLSRELSGDQFAKCMNELNRRIFELVHSPELELRICGVMCIEALCQIDVEVEESGTKVTRFSNYLRNVHSQAQGDGDELTTLLIQVTSHALGKLAQSGQGTLIQDFVDFEVRRALEWLASDRNELRRFASCCVLQQLTINAPTLLYAYTDQILDSIWVALRDQKVLVREQASQALSACMDVIKERDSDLKVQWYQLIYSECVKGFQLPQLDSVHGSLLVLSLLLTKLDHRYMDKNFVESCELVMRFRDAREPLVRRSVMSLLPLLAQFRPDDFVQNQLQHAMSYLLSLMKKPQDRSFAFVSAGRIALAVESSIAIYLDQVVIALKESLQPKQRNKLDNAAVFQCIGMLATSVGQAMSQHIQDMLDSMFQCGLSSALSQCLTDVLKNLPQLLDLVQSRLLNSLAMQLSGSPYRHPGAATRPRSAMMANQLREAQFAENKDVEAYVVALEILGHFDFHNHSLTHFAKQVVSGYLDDDVGEIRKAAAICCGQLLVNEPAEYRNNSNTVVMVNAVLDKLLTVGVSDPNPDIRMSVINSLDSRFDVHLAQAENIKTLFTALNDEEFVIREMVITIVGRLTLYNPAYILPSLRKTLIRLLTEIEYSIVSRFKEESANLLGMLVAASQRLIKPYVEPILKVLLPKAKDSSPGVASQIIIAIGELAAVGREELQSYIPDLMPLLIETMQDQTSSAKREAALRTLSQLATNTGYVIDPYWQYPTLLPILLQMIKTEQVYAIRKQALKVLGVLGALDPYRHKMNQITLDEPAYAEDRKINDFEIQLVSGPSQNEDYYPTVAIHSLIKVLNDSSLNMHHTAVVQGIMYIFKTLGTKCVPFLPQIMPPFLNMMRNSPVGLLEFHFQQLGNLVAVVKQHIRNYLLDIFELIKSHWDPLQNIQSTILTLIESIALALDTEFRIYLPNLLAHMLQILETDVSEKRQVSLKVLHAFQVFGVSVEDYLSLMIPVVIGLIENNDVPIVVRKQCIQTLTVLSRQVSFGDFASRVVHPLARVLQSNQNELKQPSLDALCALVYQLKYKYVVFIPMVHKIMRLQKLQHPNYSMVISKLLKKEPLPQEMAYQAEATASTFVDDPSQAENVLKKLPVNQNHLKKAWETSSRSTKDDWSDWLRKLSVELLKESPSHALRACASLAAAYNPLARELFNASFISCWTELYDQFQDELVRALEVALLSPTVPPEVVQILLNLAEFMEHDDKALPIDTKTLGSYAAKFHAYAKALHYKEAEFMAEALPETVEALISINNQLQQPDGAVGILKFAQQQHNIELKESWYEKLHRWEDALSAYDQRQIEEPKNIGVTLGRMRCLHALGDWEQLSQLAQERWFGTDDDTRKTIAPLGAAAAWGLGQWELMDDYIAVMKSESSDSVFFKAVLSIHRNAFDKAQLYIDKTRDQLDTELKALVGESYARAYNVVVRVQVLSELEEILVYKKFSDITERQEAIRKTWVHRLKGCQRNLDVWQRVLRVRSLVLTPQDDTEVWIKYANLCRKSGRITLSTKIFTQMLGANQPDASSDVAFNYLKHLWTTESQPETLSAMRTFTRNLSQSLEGRRKITSYKDDVLVREQVDQDTQLLARCYRKLGEWQSSLEDHMSIQTAHEVLFNYEEATKHDSENYKCWHAYALANFEVTSLFEKTQQIDVTIQHVVLAVKGFFRSIALSKSNSLQDTLRLLTLWFKYGYHQDVFNTIQEGFGTVTIDTWLQVIPQLIARIHAPSEKVRLLNHQILAEIGKVHPQSLVYSLTVASKSQSIQRKESALAIMEKMRLHSASLIDQALLVSQELIRVAILWHEMWHEALEEASRLYFGEHNAKAMFDVLTPLHQMMEKGADTLREVSFIQAFGRDLAEALEWCQKYQTTKIENDLHQAWDLYYHVFRRINKQLPLLTTLELQYVSPKLLAATELDLAVPGTYKSGEQVVRISAFASTLSVITSKQRPRKLTIKGSDGREYQYLLKGHEDMRQDERVMQLFGLVNTLLASDAETFKRHLSIQRYPVIPLSPNSGLIGWVPHCDTLHQLIRDYRESRKVLLNIEHRLMLQMAPDYDNQTLMQKVEVFQYALDQTTGQDLYKVLWLKSKNSEAWLDRRTNFARSLAVMSMVGYILGLGDRHPSNLMLDRFTGKVVHIDFGDSFEVAMHREKFPEKIPFRLTRMLVNAMEVSGIEGSFRITSENVMRVLRENKESLMAVLEAFVHDPLINWRLFGDASPAKMGRNGADGGGSSRVASQAGTLQDEEFVPSTKPTVGRLGTSLRLMSEQHLDNLSSREDEQKPEVLNSKALAVIDRVQSKLTGRDFKVLQAGIGGLGVEAQVEKLIQQATAVENLCQCYIGWCSFW